MKSKYFKIEELVSKQVYEKYKEKCWEFINPRIINFLNQLREDLGKPIIINNWKSGGEFQQRGLRTNKDPLVLNKTGLYCSQHCFGNAVDFNVKGMETKEVYDYIIKNYSNYKDYITRMENINSAPTWIHVDCANTDKNELTIFNA